MRNRLIHPLHQLGIHRFCRRSRQFVRLIEPTSLKLPDGTLYTPDIQSIYGPGWPEFREVHS